MTESDRGVPPLLGRTMILMPALNEAPVITQTIRFWQQLGARHIRVIDNGSRDDTAELARQAAAEVILEPQRGYGAAAASGLRAIPAEIDWVLFSSADGSDRLTRDELRAWQRAVDQGADLVLGERVSRPESRAQLKPVQLYGNRLACWLIRLGWRQSLLDSASLRLIRTTALARMALRDRGFGWNIEMQVRAAELGLRIVELPVTFHPRQAGESKISGTLLGTLRAGRAIIGTLGHLWWTKSSRSPAGQPAGATVLGQTPGDRTPNALRP